METATTQSVQTYLTRALDFHRSFGHLIFGMVHGSHAHNVRDDSSDYDYVGVFICPQEDFLVCTKAQLISSFL